MNRAYFFVASFGTLMFLRCASTWTNDDLLDLHGEEWVVSVTNGSETATRLAHRYGYENFGLVLGFEDAYIWRRKNYRIMKRGKQPSPEKLINNPEIYWADQQKILKRVKRGSENLRANFNDELWSEQWYLQMSVKNESTHRLGLNVLPLHQKNITGRGVMVSVLDDGLEYTHDDLKKNYDPRISYDISGRDADPFPDPNEDGGHNHGTRCAGGIAMEANNSKCGVGVAFEASIGGIKMLDDYVNDRVESEALGFRQDLIDIYTASWGPPDDGETVEGPGRLASEALERGAMKGRGGKGNIFVWASGNGGAKEDDCGCDGYVGSIYTIAVGSVSQKGKFPWYGEKCSAKMTTTPSSGDDGDQMISTTDGNNRCTTHHSGSSASAPLAAGIIALALQVNNELTWRDIQHLIVRTSDCRPLKDNPGWLKNSAGFWFNPHFGFGLMDANLLVSGAQSWATVANKSVCYQNVSTGSKNLIHGRPSTLTFKVDKCPEIAFLEHVQVETSITYSSRGALQIYLISAAGTKVQILQPRTQDKSSDGFKRWKFMSLASWGENPHGNWTLKLSDESGRSSNNGTIQDLVLILHGTSVPPNVFRKNRKNKLNSVKLRKSQW